MHRGRGRPGVAVGAGAARWALFHGQRDHPWGTIPSLSGLVRSGPGRVLSSRDPDGPVGRRSRAPAGQTTRSECKRCRLPVTERMNASIVFRSVQGLFRDCLVSPPEMPFRPQFIMRMTGGSRGWVPGWVASARDAASERSRAPLRPMFRARNRVVSPLGNGFCRDLTTPRRASIRYVPPARPGCSWDIPETPRSPRASCGFSLPRGRVPGGVGDHRRRHDGSDG